jgi:hypothetical protein
MLTSPLLVMDVDTLSKAWQKSHSDGNGDVVTREQHVIFDLRMVTIWQSCHLATFALRKIKKNLWPVFSTSLSLTLFCAAFKQIFSPKKRLVTIHKIECHYEKI